MKIIVVNTLHKIYNKINNKNSQMMIQMKILKMKINNKKVKYFFILFLYFFNKYYIFIYYFKNLDFFQDYLEFLKVMTSQSNNKKIKI